MQELHREKLRLPQGNFPTVRGVVGTPTGMSRRHSANTVTHTLQTQNSISTSTHTPGCVCVKVKWTLQQKCTMQGETAKKSITSWCWCASGVCEVRCSDELVRGHGDSEGGPCFGRLH
jgi:hypothetical protein